MELIYDAEINVKISAIDLLFNVIDLLSESQIGEIEEMILDKLN